jgi:hypothetical protein
VGGLTVLLDACAVHTGTYIHARIHACAYDVQSFDGKFRVIGLAHIHWEQQASQPQSRCADADVRLLHVTYRV